MAAFAFVVGLIGFVFGLGMYKIGYARGQRNENIRCIASITEDPKWT